jgi:hypothetical protein
VWLRTDAARRYKKVANAEALIWKSLTIAEKKFPRFNSPELLEQVNNGQLFEDPVAVTYLGGIWISHCVPGSQGQMRERRYCAVQVAAEVNRLSLPEMPAVLD